ncbi:hypothetical protein HDU78_003990 [Chytriomyces hyalinus]|nr:hypothetical protein HDU78_003990 [Chytriomyces hyalinus]
MTKIMQGAAEDSNAVELTEFKPEEWKKDVLTGRIIVVALDGSHHSSKAFYWSINNLIKTSNGVENKLALISCTSNDVSEGARSRAEALLRSHMSLVKEAGLVLPIRAFLVKGDPREAICDMVDKLQADVLVVGTRGLTNFKRVVMGSVSEYLTKNANCSVLVAK